MVESLKKSGLLISVLLLALLLIIFYGSWWMESELKDLAIYSGWTLASLSLFLTLYNLRKKITSLPLGRAWYWRKLHSFAGWLAMAVFFIHAGVSPPVGTLHLMMWWLYLFMLLTGVAGLWFSLGLPPRIAQGGERLQFERIPGLCQAQSRRAESVILEASREGVGEPLQAFHKRYLRDYLSGVREQFRHCINSPLTAKEILQELNNIARYIKKDSRSYVLELEEIIHVKNELDRQFALQNVLRKWVYVHVATNYISWVMIGMHVLLIYTFRGEYGL